MGAAPAAPVAATSIRLLAAAIQAPIPSLPRSPGLPGSPGSPLRRACRRQSQSRGGTNTMLARASIDWNQGIGMLERPTLSAT